MPNYNIHIFGAGGIGSYLIDCVSKLSKHKQLDYSGNKLAKIIMYDDDEVEQKNLSYQNYETGDLYESKVAALAARYPIFTPMIMRVTEQNLNEIHLSSTVNDIFISCVDNAEFRAAFFRSFIGLRHWIDSRCNGKLISVYTENKDNTLEYMLKTLPSEDTEVSGSCQTAADLTAGTIQQSNRVVAAYVSQLILNILRGQYSNPRFIVQI